MAPGHRQGGRDRRRGGHHRRPVDRRAGHAADAADLPHRRCRRRGHHARSPARRGAVRGAQAEGPGGARRRSRARSSVEDTEKGLKVDRSPTPAARSTPTRSRAARACCVEQGQKVKAGDQLNEGSIYPHDLLAYGGETSRRGAPRPSCTSSSEVQKVYKSQGVDINDKHIEVIVRQMMKKVRVDQKGDTDLPAGPVRRPQRDARR